MELKTLISIRQKELKKLDSKVLSIEEEIYHLENKKSVSMRDFLNGIDKYYSVELVQKEYEEEYEDHSCLRSYVNTRTICGTVTVVTIDKKYYLTPEQIQILENYLKSQYHIEKIEIIKGYE